jgi:hypothetical protein
MVCLRILHDHLFHLFWLKATRLDTGFWVAHQSANSAADRLLDCAPLTSTQERL